MDWLTFGQVCLLHPKRCRRTADWHRRRVGHEIRSSFSTWGAKAMATMSPSSRTTTAAAPASSSLRTRTTRWVDRADLVALPVHSSTCLTSKPGSSCRPSAPSCRDARLRLATPAAFTARRCRASRSCLRCSLRVEAALAVSWSKPIVARPPAPTCVAWPARVRVHTHARVARGPRTLAGLRLSSH